MATSGSALDPGLAEAHLGAGLAALAGGRLHDAEASLLQALALDPPFSAGVRNNLGETYRALGRPEQAMVQYHAALRIDPDLAIARLNLAETLHALGDSGATLAQLDHVLAALPPVPQAHNLLGIIRFEQARIDESLASFRSALAARPDFAEARINLARLLGVQGLAGEAVRVLCDGLAGDPANASLRSAVAEALRQAPLAAEAADVQLILASLCVDDGVSMMHLSRAVACASKSQFAFPGMLEAARRNGGTLETSGDEVRNFQQSAVLLAALPRMTADDVELELVLTALRRSLMSEAAGGENALIHRREGRFEFACALARHCFFNGYAYMVSRDEERLLQTAAKRLEAGLARANQDPVELEDLLLLFALYRPIGSLTGAERLLRPAPGDWSTPFQAVVEQQLRDPARERELARSIPALTKIKDSVSLAVKKQYEESPYPPWASLGRPEPIRCLQELQRLRPGLRAGCFPDPLPVLVAGCGTGHHAISTALRYRDAEVLAVDLSRASLAYAARMAERYAVRNIRFAQADLLELGRTEHRFALIECAGVLHHMRNLMEGWRVLSQLLLPGGFMTVGLYSSRARGRINAAREWVRANGFASTAEGIRTCRRALIGLPPDHEARFAASFGDFYSLNGCRDLIMHVEEKMVTVPQIADCLAQLGLKFLKFNADLRTLARFNDMFPAPGAQADLDKWERFEERFPDRKSVV